MQLAVYAWGFLAGTGAISLLLWLMLKPVNEDNRWTAIVAAFILGNSYIIGRILGG